MHYVFFGQILAGKNITHIMRYVFSGKDLAECRFRR